MHERIKNLTATVAGWLKTNILFLIIVIVMLVGAAFSLAYAFMSVQGTSNSTAQADELEKPTLHPHELLKPIPDNDDISGNVQSHSTKNEHDSNCARESQNDKGCEHSASNHSACKANEKIPKNLPVVSEAECTDPL